MVIPRGAYETGTQLGACKPFAARPIPQGAKGDRQTDLRWSAGQYEELQQVLGEYERRIAALEGTVADLQDAVTALQDAIGDGTWDG
jgi:hypothetical protein